MLSGNNQVVSLRNEHFNVVHAVAKVVVSVVQSFLFDNLVGGEMSSLHRILSSGEPLLLLGVKTSPLRGSISFSDDEVWLEAVSLVKWILANVSHYALFALIFFLPF